MGGMGGGGGVQRMLGGGGIQSALQMFPPCALSLAQEIRN